MKIQTFSVVVGGKKCNATCPYCVSKMTGKEGCCTEKVEDINMRNFHKACKFAKMSGVSTVLLTGKGEPTLYPEHIKKYIEVLNDYDFPFIELQTNGILLKELSLQLAEWYHLGLTTVSLSCAHYDTFRNKDIIGEDFVSLENNIKLLHRIGFSVRVSCVMVKGYIDNISRVIGFTDICRKWGVEQFTVRPVSLPLYKDHNTKVSEWAEEHLISQAYIERYFDGSSKTQLLLELAHGAKVYDYDGQNISINTCLTESSNPDEVRQLIFFPDGHLRYSWVYDGAIIL